MGSGTSPNSCGCWEGEQPLVALLDVNLGTELVTSVAAALKARNIPFAVASADDGPKHYVGAALVGVPNAREPENAPRVAEVLALLTSEWRVPRSALLGGGRSVLAAGMDRNTTMVCHRFLNGTCARCRPIE